MGKSFIDIAKESAIIAKKCLFCLNRNKNITLNA
jgi:hypothetical protein